MGVDSFKKVFEQGDLIHRLSQHKEHLAVDGYFQAVQPAIKKFPQNCVVAILNRERFSILMLSNGDDSAT